MKWMTRVAKNNGLTLFSSQCKQMHSSHYLAGCLAKGSVKLLSASGSEEKKHSVLILFQYWVQYWELFFSVFGPYWILSFFQYWNSIENGFCSVFSTNCVTVLSTDFTFSVFCQHRVLNCVSIRSVLCPDFVLSILSVLSTEFVSVKVQY